MQRWLLVIPRLYLGTIFLVAAVSKITAPGGFEKALPRFLQVVALTHAPQWYQAFVQNVVMPHAGLFAALVIAGELCVGIAMLLGIGTRFASVIAVVLLANYLTAKGMPIWAPASNDAADIVLALLVGAGAAGHVYGFDGLIQSRLARARLQSGSAN